MIKILLFISAFCLIPSAFLFLYLFNRTLNVFPNCVYYGPKQDKPTVYLIGKVTRVQEKSDWFISNLELCDNSLFNIANVQIYTPKNEAYFDVGGEITYKETQGYQWNKFPIDTFKSVVNKNNLLAVRVEELKSKEAVLGLFKDLKDFDCESQAICRNRLVFVQAQGLLQVNFLNNLKSKNIFPLFLDFVSGKAVVYSQEFGKVKSLEHFKQLKDRLLL